MTKREFSKLKKIVDKLLEKATDEALAEGVNTASEEFEVLLTNLKKGILAERGISLEEYEIAEKGKEEDEEISKETLGLLTMGKEKIQEIIKGLKDESLAKVDALAQKSNKEIQDLTQKTDNQKEQFLAQIQTFNSNLLKELKNQRDISKNEMAEVVRMIRDNTIVKEKEIESIKSQNAQSVKYQNWLKKYQEWLLTKIEQLEKQTFISPSEKKRLKELDKKSLDKWLEDYLRNWTAWPVRGLRRATQEELNKFKAGFVDAETPTGAINGSNKTFILAHTPNPVTSLKVFVNGIRQELTTHYTLSGQTLTMVRAYPTGTNIKVEYRY